MARSLGPDTVLIEHSGVEGAAEVPAHLLAYYQSKGWKEQKQTSAQKATQKESSKS